MMKICKVFFLVLVSVLAFSSFADSISPPRIVSAKHVENIIIDGFLEKDWFQVEPASDFVMTHPSDGVAASQPTEVYILYSDEALFIAFECHDESPESINAYLNKRDSRGGSDAVYLELDTFDDNVNGYFFGVTASGVQFDGKYLNETWNDYTWNGIWESKVRQHEGGWTVEMKVPFQCFRHDGFQGDGWGLNARRVVRRTNEWQSWIPFKKDESNRVSKWGMLTGLGDLPSSSHVEILPHAVGQWEQEDGGLMRSINEYENLGFDIKIVPSSALTLDLTYQPDFAQVEVDQAFINLNPYPIYLQEKRPFFIEGMSLFDTHGFSLLYTRKITDPDFGARINGQFGDVKSSMLAAQNRTEDGEIQYTGAARATKNIGKSSTLGFTSTYLFQEEYNKDFEVDTTDMGVKIPFDVVDLHAAVASIDGRLRWGEFNQYTFMATAVERTESDDQPFGVNMSVFLRKNDWRGNFWSTYKGKDFEINDLGFSGYTNLIAGGTWVGRNVYLDQGYFSELHLNVNFNNEIMPDGRFWEKGGNFNCNLKTENNSWWGGGLAIGDGFFRLRPDDDEEDLPQYSKYSDNFGGFNPEYHPWRSIWVWYDSDTRKLFYWEWNLDYGTHREGTSFDGELEGTYKVRSNFEISGEYNLQRIKNAYEVNEGDRTDFHVLVSKASWSPSLNVSLRGTFQYVLENRHTLIDVEKDNDVLLNLLFAWNYQPGSWLYLVYDDSRGAYFDDYNAVQRNWNRGDRTVRMKWTYFFTAP
jgi:Domain of unknown function (DUF5916)